MTLNFKEYKDRYRQAIRRVLAESEQGRLDEAGFPAYSHSNPLINWLFWQRLHTAMKYVQSAAPYQHILDFGCGSGVMLPFLAGAGKEVTALDVDLLPLERVKKYIPLAENVHVLDAKQDSIESLPQGSFDLIIALDVLEHVKDLPATLKTLMSLLKPGGRIVVSGPTENILYQIGRRIAGPEYSGDYHERGIQEIRNELKKISIIEPIATLYQPIPLFEVFAAKK